VTFWLKNTEIYSCWNKLHQCAAPIFYERFQNNNLKHLSILASHSAKQIHRHRKKIRMADEEQIFDNLS